MADVPVARPRSGAQFRGLVLATHLGPTVAVTLVATLLGVTAGVGPGRATLLGLAVLSFRRRDL